MKCGPNSLTITPRIMCAPTICVHIVSLRAILRSNMGQQLASLADCPILRPKITRSATHSVTHKYFTTPLIHLPNNVRPNITRTIALDSHFRNNMHLSLRSSCILWRKSLPIAHFCATF